MEDTTQRRQHLRTSPMGNIRFLAYPWSQLLSEWAKRVPAPYQGQPLHELELLLDAEVLPTMLHLSTPHHDEISEALYVRTLYNIRLESLCFGAFVATGKETFSFSPGLAYELRHTDILEARLSQLQLPYPAFFVHFGQQEGIEIYDDQRVMPETFDGAFVWRLNDGTLNLALTFGRTGASSSGLPGPVCQISSDLLSLPAVMAVRRGLEKCAAECMETQLAMATSSDARLELSKQASSFSDAVEAATNLVVNALFYLTSYRSHEQAAPQPSTPAFLTDKLHRARNTKQQHEAQNAIQKAGFTLVRMCGSEIPDRSQHQDTTTAITGAGSLIRTHWRRGHWRNQRYGHALLLEKLVWVRPTLIAPGRDAIEGRMYAVEEGWGSIQSPNSQGSAVVQIMKNVT